MAAYRQVVGFKSPAGWLHVHRDQRSVTSMGKLYLYLFLFGLLQLQQTNRSISIMFGSHIAEKASNQSKLYFPTSPNYCCCTTWQNMKTQKSHLFTKMLYWYLLFHSRRLMSSILTTGNWYSHCHTTL